MADMSLCGPQEGDGRMGAEDCRTTLFRFAEMLQPLVPRLVVREDVDYARRSSPWLAIDAEDLHLNLLLLQTVRASSAAAALTLREPA